ncbi:hypothetical protein ACWDUG_13320, partial [Streptomyces cellulosae]
AYTAPRTLLRTRDRGEGRRHPLVATLMALPLALQWAETALYLGLALALTGFCAWWIRRRVT